jgi:hypothetical protein
MIPQGFSESEAILMGDKARGTSTSLGGGLARGEKARGEKESIEN